MRSKKIISCLMALSILGTSSLMFGGTAKAASIAPSTTVQTLAYTDYSFDVHKSGNKVIAQISPNVDSSHSYTIRADYYNTKNGEPQGRQINSYVNPSSFKIDSGETIVIRFYIDNSFKASRVIVN